MFLYIMVGGFVDGFIDAFNIGNGLVDVWWGNALARSVWVMLLYQLFESSNSSEL